MLTLPLQRRQLSAAAMRWALLFSLLVLLWPQAASAQAATTTQTNPADAPAAATSAPIIHIPYAMGSPDPAKGAIFWLGMVDPANNHANVRMVFTDEGVAVVLHVFDRLLAYDENASANSAVRCRALTGLPSRCALMP